MGLDIGMKPDRNAHRAQESIESSDRAVVEAHLLGEDHSSKTDPRISNGIPKQHSVQGAAKRIEWQEAGEDGRCKADLPVYDMGHVINANFGRRGSYAYVD